MASYLHIPRSGRFSTCFTYICCRRSFFSSTSEVYSALHSKDTLHTMAPTANQDNISKPKLPLASRYHGYFKNDIHSLRAEPLLSSLLPDGVTIPDEAEPMEAQTLNIVNNGVGPKVQGKKVRTTINPPVPANPIAGHHCWSWHIWTLRRVRIEKSRIRRPDIRGLVSSWRSCYHLQRSLLRPRPSW